VALLAAGAHSVADTVNQVFLLVSLNLGDNPADEEHPYGHGKERFFWAVLAASFIVIAGAAFSLYEGAK
jgi:divalent metal cation (Fe/Co/Zn/Cd) transporter